MRVIRQFVVYLALGLNEMNDVHNVTSQHWQMQLPSDWREESDHLEGAIYFVSGDDSKGMYIGTWQFDNDSRTAEQLLKHFEKVQLEQNSDAEAQWKVLQVRTSSSGAVHSLTLDSYDEANKYRVILQKSTNQWGQTQQINGVRHD